MSTIYGQNLRIYIGESTSEKVLAASTSCTVHLSAGLEEATTKDDADSTGLWTKQEVTSKSWDMSADVNFIDSDETGLAAEDLIGLFGTEVTVSFAHTSGTDNRTKGTVIYTGKGYISDVNISAAAKSKATVSIQITGNGALS